MRGENRNSIVAQDLVQRREDSPPPLWGRVREGGNLTRIARMLRKNMTKVEQKLWDALRQQKLGYKFWRQEPIGCDIVGFVCYEKKLIVEVDGGQHLDSMTDGKRDEWLKARGFRVLKVWNQEVVHNLKGVVRRILEELDSPPPQSSPMKGEEGTPPHQFSLVKGGEGEEEEGE